MLAIVLRDGEWLLLRDRNTGTESRIQVACKKSGVNSRVVIDAPPEVEVTKFGTKESRRGP